MSSGLNFDIPRFDHLKGDAKMDAVLRHLVSTAKKLNELQQSLANQSQATAVSVVNSIVSGGSSGGGGGSSSLISHVNKRTDYPLVAGLNTIPFTDPFDDITYGLMAQAYVEDPPGYKYVIPHTFGTLGLNNFELYVDQPSLLWLIAIG